MPAVPVIPDFGTGIVPGTTLNQLADALRFAMAPPKVKAYQTVAQALANGIQAAIIFDSVEFDTHTMWSSGAATRITAQYPGYYLLSGGVATVVNDTSYRFARIAVNGTTLTDGSTAMDPVPSVSTRMPIRATITYLDIDDYVELYASQASGGSLNTAVAVGDASNLTVAWLGQ